MAGALGDVNATGSGGQAAALDRGRRDVERRAGGGATLLRFGDGGAAKAALPGACESASFRAMSEGEPSERDRTRREQTPREGAGDTVGRRAPGDMGGGEAFGAGVDGEAFGTLYRRHFAELARYVLRNFGAGPPEPEDVAQQAFLRLQKAKSAVDNVGAFLRRTARNFVIDEYRRSILTETIMASVQVLEEAREEVSAEDLLVSKGELEGVNEMLACLTAKERVAFLLFRVDGANFAEIAAHLGISNSGARYLVSSAFDRLGGALEKRP